MFQQPHGSTPATGIVTRWISGVPRSGTTLLANLLSAHPDLIVIHETLYLRAFLRLARSERRSRGWGSALNAAIAVLRSRPLPKAQNDWYREAFYKVVQDDIANNARMKGLPDGVRPAEGLVRDHQVLAEGHEIQAWARKATDALSTAGGERSARIAAADAIVALHEFQRNRAGRRYWCNKTPGLAHHLSDLMALLNRVRMVHLIRDGRDVVTSWVRHRARQEHLPNLAVREAARRWSRLVTEARVQGAQAPDAYLEVRYEDLVASPGNELRRICDFFDIEATGDVIMGAYHERAVALGRGAVHQASIGKWRDLDSASLDEIIRVAKPALDAFGYIDDA